MVGYMIRNIIFDIGNVLADFGWRDFFGKFGYEGETIETGGGYRKKCRVG